MKKTYVLDTSTIISDPYCLDSFPDSDIIIHIKVLAELDKLKTTPGEVGRNARVFIRMLDEVSEQENISEGIYIGEQTLVKIDSNHYEVDFGDQNYTDDVLIACAVCLNKYSSVTVISQDISLRLKARTLGVDAVSHKKERSSVEEIYGGIKTIVDERCGEMLKEYYMIDCCENHQLTKLLPNESVIFLNEKRKTIAYGRKKGSKIKFVNQTKAWGLEARKGNAEQAIALDLLMDPDIPLVSLVGMAGSGKTILAMAAGIESVASLKIYKKMMIFRPIQSVGAEMGYLPGTLDEKLDPWMGAIKDSVEILSVNRFKNNSRNKNNWKDCLGQFSDQIQIEALAYIRGRSISDTFILVDEVQNITQADIKTILTRAGEGSKIVLTGDIEQIDAHQLDALNNGLTYVVDKFKGSELAGHVSLKKGERSPLAEEAALLL